MNKAIFPVALALSLVACGDTDDRDRSHVDEINTGDLAPFKGKQRFVPEYAPNPSGVIVSYLLPLATKGGVEIVKTVLDAGVGTIYMTAPEDDTNEDLVESLSRLRRGLGSSIDRIKLVRQPVHTTLRQVMEENNPGRGRIPSVDDGPRPPDKLPTIWARDWSPLSTVTPSGETRFVDVKYFPNRPIDDGVPIRLSSDLTRKRIALPVYNEGGNFMASENGDCFMSDQVVIANARVRAPGDEVISQQRIESFYNDYVGCKRTIIMPNVANEPTGHIDVWAKLVAKDKVLVAEMSDATLARATGDMSHLINEQIQTDLRARAEDFRRLGYTVIPVPFPLKLRVLAHLDTTRSYTNALQINGTVIVPRYVKEVFGPYPDDDLIAEYEQKVGDAYRSVGLNPVFITVDDLISMRGAIHCVTMEVR